MTERAIDLPSEIMLIVGMHRSGTSFLAECMNAMGFALPADIGGPAPDNPRGHFEPRGIVALNDEILARQGAAWDRVSPVDLPENIAGQLERIDDAVAASFPAQHRALIKDPRLSLLMPLWRNWLDTRDIRATALIALRDPREVAQSLARRDGIGAEFAMLSWAGHTLGALNGTDGLARTLVAFPGWLDQIAPTLDRIAALAKVDRPTAAIDAVRDSFVAGAVHGGIDAPDGPVARLSLELYDLLHRAAAQGTVPDSTQLAPFTDKLMQLSAPVRTAEDRHAQRSLQARGQLAALEQDVAARTRDADVLRDQIARTESQRDAAEARLNASQQDARGLIDRAHAAEHQRDEAAAEAARHLTAAQAHRDALGSQLVATEAQRDESMAALATTTAQRDDAVAALATTAAQRNELAAAHAAADALVEATEAQRDEMTDIAHDLRAQLDHAEAHLQDTQTQLATTLTFLEKERMTLLKPAYRRMYRLGGRMLRGVLSAGAVEKAKRRLPMPGGIPAALAYTPLAAAAHTAGYGDIAPRTSDKPDIFVMSIINWDFRVQRPQHLATEMAAAGHRVFYIEMEHDHGPGSARQVAPGVHVIRLPHRGMRFLKAYTGVPTGAQTRAWIAHFHALADAVGAGPVAHVVIEHPYWWHLAQHLSPEYQVTFDCMDDIGGFSNTEPHVLEAELDMIARADKMIVSSQYLYDKFSRVRDVVMVRNGTDVSHFIRDPEAEPAPDWLAPKLKQGGIRVGYVGAIAEWFDTDMLEAVARDNPDFDIHLCGAVTAQPPLRLGKLANVTLHGEIPYKDVPAFHKQMDVLIIPFQLLPIIRACDPVKFYEYSAVMRATVSTSLPELERAGDLVFTADTAADFGAAIRKAAPLAHDAAFGARLRQYALDNAWSFRASDLLAEMAHEPKLSVVVLHYGDDTALTLATLHAMLGQGQVYPNLEVVLVDNGSSPDVLAILRDRATTDARIKLVVNGQNVGFARGNNAGIVAASGDYVLLLNNDTFLAPNALLAMVRHLQRNPDIGIVGPMTNNIGNEARIEIAYADMDDMARAARDLATGHRGQWTPIAVCAYFCAMFRRADLDHFGDLPEIYGRGMFEDDDHCAIFRKAGFQMALAEDAFCHHHLSATFDALPSGEKQALFDRNKTLFEERWGKWVPHAYRETRPESTVTDR